MTNRELRRIDAALDKLERNSSLTSDGRNWLVSACDPFHDFDIAISGYPDVLTAATVVQLVKQQLQITVPTTGGGIVTSGSNWDCSIALFPNVAPGFINQSSIVTANGGVTATTSGNGFLYGGLVSGAGPQGGAMWPNGPGTGGINPSASYQQLSPNAYIKGQGRVIGMGFEVVNTTAEINKQGQVTAWRMPTKWTPSQFAFTYLTTPNVNATFTYMVERLPPATIAQAQLLFGSRSWAAAEGAYVVSRQNSTENSALIPTFFPAGFVLGDYQNGVADTMFGPGPGVVNQSASVTSDYFLPFDISGVHFTGLSYNTTLTVNVRWYIERIPGPMEADLVVMATPSACFDPIALELYCRAMGEMPPGVMLKENFLGEWFSNALSKVSEWAPKIGDALGNVLPGASLVGKLVGGGANMIAKATSERIQPQPKTVLMDSRSHAVQLNQNPKPVVQTPKKKKKKIVYTRK